MKTGGALALFDLDHTLIDFDSGLSWIGFLVRRGVAPPGADARHLDACRAYVDGRAGIAELHRSSLAPVAGLPAERVHALAEEHAAALEDRLPAASRHLVRSHLDRGHLCAVVTATSHLIAGPIVRRFGIDALLATRSARAGDGYGGAIDGSACHGAAKLEHLQRWLAGRGARLADFERSWFYSDAAGDLPLLQAVSDPVAVRPDARLRAVAEARGWPIL